jgi:hypothetical protein
MTVNYSDPRVRGLIQRALALALQGGDNPTASFYKKMLSGELAKPENFFSGNTSDDAEWPEKLPPISAAKAIAVTLSNQPRTMWLIGIVLLTAIGITMTIRRRRRTQ